MACRLPENYKSPYISLPNFEHFVNYFREIFRISYSHFVHTNSRSISTAPAERVRRSINQMANSRNQNDNGEEAQTELSQPVDQSASVRVRGCGMGRKINENCYQITEIYIKLT